MKPGGYNLYASEMAELKSKYLLTPNLGDEAEKVLTSFLSERDTEGKQIQAADEKLTQLQQQLAAAQAAPAPEQKKSMVKRIGKELRRFKKRS